MSESLSMTVSFTVDEAGKVELYGEDPKLTEPIRFLLPAGSKAEVAVRDAVLAKSWRDPETVAVTGLRWEELVTPMHAFVSLFGDADGVADAAAGFEEEFTSTGAEVIWVETYPEMTKAVSRLKEANRRIRVVQNTKAGSKRVLVIVDAARLLEASHPTRLDSVLRQFLMLLRQGKAPWSTALCFGGEVPKGAGVGTGKGSWVYPDVRPVVALGESVKWPDVEPLLLLSAEDADELVTAEDRWVYRADRGTVVFVE